MPGATSEDFRPFDAIPFVEMPDSALTDLPHATARMAVEHGPMFRQVLPAGHPFGHSIVFMVGPEANRFLLHTNRAAFSNDLGWSPYVGIVFEQGLLNLDDPRHSHDRAMMTPGFVSSYVHRYLPIMKRVIERRTAGWPEQGEIDVYDEARAITLDVVGECFMNFRSIPDLDRLRYLLYHLMHPFGLEGDHATITEALDLMVAGTRADTNSRLRDTYGRLAASAGDTSTLDQALNEIGELNTMLMRMITRRRREPADDLLGMLVTSQDDEGHPFSDRELLGHLHLLFVAGHETTTTLVGWLLYLLATHPDVLADLHSELDAEFEQSGGEVTMKMLRTTRLLGAAVNETLRLHSPVSFAPRLATSDFDFAGYQAPAGTRVHLSIAGGHRLPSVFTDPDTFDPYRFMSPRHEDRIHPYSFVPFSAGARVCLGVNFAQVEVKALVAHVLRRWTLAPAPPRKIVEYFPVPTPSIPTGLTVCLVPRDSSADG